MLNDITILITAVGTQSMPGLADCFHNNGERKIKIIGADISDDYTINQIVDKFYKVPRVYESNYIDSLIEICRNENVNIFFPFMDEEMELIYNRIDDFTAIGVKVSLPSKNAIDITIDKLRFYNFMKDNNLPVPEYYSAISIEDLENACTQLGYPKKAVCIKTLGSSGSRGIRILKEDIDLYNIFLNEKPNSLFMKKDAFIKMLSGVKVLKPMMVMEYLPGKECSVDLLADNGKVKYMVGRVSNNVLASIPQDCVLKEVKDAYDLCEQIVKLLNFDGNADFDFKFNERGVPVLMEVNPRLAATMAVIAIGGVNLPYLRIKQILGEKLPNIKVNYGVKMKRRYLDMFIDKDGNNLYWE